ncbi:MAG TPA: acyltransferase, partial [Thermodesulfobacteriota bacterium]|nr:acyltransferase [Thermodesulfobacteriota bacterium]
MNERLDRIPSLDGLRAISITFVIIGHLLYTQTPFFIRLYEAGGKWFTHLAPLGVRIFFVISGFLITGLLLRELDAKKHINLTKFYFRRTLRIFPPYYFFILVIIILQAVGLIKLAPNDLPHALTYTVNYYSERSWYLAHAWSLSVEEQFYLLWPVVLLFAGKLRGLWIAFFIIILCPVIRLGIWYFFHSLVEYEMGYRFETVADSIAVGCVLAGTHDWLKHQKAYHKILESRLFILVPIVVFYASTLPAISRLSILFGITIQNLGIAACIAWCITNYSSKVGRVLNSKPMVFLGVMSYSIYLWQQLFLNPNSSSIISQFPFNLALVGAASLASYYFIERPSLGIRHRLETRVFTHSKRRATQVETIPLTDDGIRSSRSFIILLFFLPKAASVHQLTKVM